MTDTTHPFHPVNSLNLIRAAGERIASAATRCEVQPPLPIPAVKRPALLDTLNDRAQQDGWGVSITNFYSGHKWDSTLRSPGSTGEVGGDWIRTLTPTRIVGILEKLEALADEVEAVAEAHEAQVKSAIEKALKSEEPAMRKLAERLSQEAQRPRLEREEDLAALGDAPPHMRERYDAGLLPLAELKAALQDHFLPRIADFSLTFRTAQDLERAAGPNAPVHEFEVICRKTTSIEDVSPEEWETLKAIRAALPPGAEAQPVDDLIDCNVDECTAHIVHVRRIRCELKLPSGQSVVRRYDL